MRNHHGHHHASATRVSDLIIAEVAEDVASFLAEAGKLDAAMSLSALALELRESIAAAEGGGAAALHASKNFTSMNGGSGGGVGGGSGGAGDHNDDHAKQVLANKLDLAEALSMHANLYHRLGMAHRATPLLRRSHTILKDWLGPHDPKTVAMLNEVATACTATGRYADALVVYQEIETSLEAHATLMDKARVKLGFIENQPTTN